MYNVHLTHSLLCFEFVEFTLISFIGYYFIRLKAYSSEQRKISMYKYKIFFKKNQHIKYHFFRNKHNLKRCVQNHYF